jgi:Family of unknown function (DUF6188)
VNDLAFLVGQKVVEVLDDCRVVFLTSAAPEPTLYVDASGPFDCTDGNGAPLAAAALVGRTVASVSTVHGVLDIAFTDGVALRCPPSTEFEAWQVVGGAPAHLVVSMPGGEVAVFDQQSIPVRQLRERDPGAAAALDKMLGEFGIPTPTSFPPESE